MWQLQVGFLGRIFSHCTRLQVAYASVCRQAEDDRPVAGEELN